MATSKIGNLNHGKKIETMKRILLFFIYILLLNICMLAQEKSFTLEDLNFGGHNYRNMVAKNRHFTWWGDRLMEQSKTEGNELSTTKGTPKTHFTLVDVNVALPADDQLSSLADATYPYPESSLVLLQSEKKRFLYDFEQKKVVWSQPCEDEEYSDFCATARATAFVRNEQLCVTDANGETRQLTQDGSYEIVYGQSVHRDEFGIYKGTFWSPNGKKLAFYRMDQSMVTDYPLVDIDTRIATEAPIKYPMAGETSHVVTVGVYDLSSGETIYLDAGNPVDRYFTNIQWSPDGKQIYMIEMNRDQTDYELTTYDATSGRKMATLYQEHHDKYVHPVNTITFLPWNSNQFILQSEKDGYNHLYLMNTKGEMLRQLTSGEWIVLDLLGFNKKKKSAIILSTESSPIQNNLYSVDLKTGRRTLLDDGKGCHANIYEASGHHDEVLSTSGEFIFDNYTEPDVPRKIDIINTSKKTRQNIFEAENPWRGYKVPEYSCGTLKAADGKTDLYYRMVKPVDFDPTKKYPTIVYVYGGPGLRNVEARWNYWSRGWETYMAQKGYLLFILDNRGSKDRGRDFEQVTYRHLGEEEMLDQLQGVDYLKSLPYVDSDRLGVHGWSYGGYMTISLMTTYPDVFKVGVAGGPVIDWKYYEVMYGERYMDTPQDNPEGYERTSCINKAKNLKGKLQIIIGLNDPVVVPQHALSFIKSCIQEGTQPDFFVYPGEPHNMRGHQSTHLHERISQYFDDYLK